MPKELLAKVLEAEQKFDQGFKTTEYLAAALLEEGAELCLGGLIGNVSDVQSLAHSHSRSAARSCVAARSPVAAF